MASTQMTTEDEKERAGLLMSSSDVSDAELPKTSQSSARRVVASMVGLAVIGLVVYAAASQQTSHSLRHGNTKNTQTLILEHPSTFYLIKSTFKNSTNKDDWWTSYNAMANDPAASQEATDQDTALGTHFLFWMPLSRDGEQFHIWEVQHGKSFDDLKDHLNHDTDTKCGKLLHGLDNTIMKIPTSLSGPFPYSFFDHPFSGRRLMGESPDPTFYLVHHTFKHESDITPWWSELVKMMTNETAYEESTKANKEKGYVNTFFAPVAKNSIYCLWQADAGKVKADFEKFLEETKPMSDLDNDVMEIPNSLTGGYPGPYLPEDRK